MKGKKWCCFVLMVLAVTFIMSGLPAFAETEAINIEELEEYYNTESSNSPVKFSESLASYYLSFEHFGTFCSLGEIDLSKFDTLTIAYGCDTSALLALDNGETTYLALTTTGAIQEAVTGNFIDSSNILGKVEITTPFMSWGADELDIPIDSDYKGEVFLASYNVVDGHNIIISDIYFWNQDAQIEEPTEAPTEGPKGTDAPATEKPTVTPETKATATPVPSETEEPGGDSGKLPIIPIVIGVVALAAVATVVVIIVMKKKKTK